MKQVGFVTRLVSIFYYIKLKKYIFLDNKINLVCEIVDKYCFSLYNKYINFLERNDYNGFNTHRKNPTGAFN